MSNSAWDQAQGLADKHGSGSGGLFVRLANNGDKIVGSFVGEPFAREVHWTGERYEECGGEGCEYCAEGKRPSLRVSMNFYATADRALKVIEGGVMWFKDLLKVRDKYGLDKWTFEVERHGDAGDPKTTYTILPDEKLTKEQQKEIEDLRLHDLAKVASGDSSSSSSFDSYDKSGGGALIDARLASELVSRLKALPRDAVDTFLEKFGVKRIRDLKAADKAAAKEFVESLESKNGRGPAEASDEVDPFA